MSIPAPPLDPRSADDIQQQLVALLKTYVPTLTSPDSGASAALTGVFARYAELIIERLNQVPDKNRLAFFDLIGVSPSPPQAARVPLSFTLAPGATEATVPARTPVAAPAGPGRDQPLLFETERQLAVTPAKLTRIFAWDGLGDRSIDLSAAAVSSLDAGTELFGGDSWKDAGNHHILYLGLDEPFGLEKVFALTLNASFDPQNLGSDPHEVIWEAWDGQVWTALPPPLGHEGSDYSDLRLTQPGAWQWAGLAQIPFSSIAGISRRWLRARLDRPLNFSGAPDPARVLPNSLPDTVTLTRSGLGGDDSCPLDRSFVWLPSTEKSPFATLAPLDTSLVFYPFGQNLYVNSVWYLASSKIFSKVGLTIELSFDQGGGQQSPDSALSADVKLTWEYWTGKVWTVFGNSTNAAVTTPVGVCNFLDRSGSFTKAGGTISWAFSDPPVPTSVNGVENYWIRVRSTGGSYAYQDSSIEVGSKAHNIPLCLASVKLSYATANPPVISSFDAVIGYDGLQYKSLPRDAFTPFAAAADSGRSLYLAFELPAALTVFPQRAVSLYFDFELPGYGDIADDPSASAPPILTWFYWSGQDWPRLLVRDETQAFSSSGMIEFLPPTDFKPTALFDQQPRYWLRLAWTDGDYRYLPRLRRVLQNAVMGVQASTVGNEILGSSNGGAAQRFTAARKPVLAGVQLEVREPALPSAAERAALIAEEGADAITPLTDAGGAWVRWHEIGDFHGSGPRDRHYVLDHLSGDVLFGDGSSGLIPPRGAGNIRLARYSSGGGDAGNAEAGAITQLKTTVPFVAGVTNPLAAGGGVGAESLDAVVDRAPRGIRHGQRAVTFEDYEDLAKLASTEVARARCAPLLDLREVKADGTQPTPRAGQLSLIIVPVSKALQPTPSAELIERVRQFLDARRLPGVDLFVLGAEYVSVDVTVEIGLKDLSAARDVELAVRAALEGFLHPLTGGFDGAGWDFGRHAHRSDLYALLEALDGVDYVRTLAVTETAADPKDPSANQTDRFLICSGNHRIDLYYGS